MLIKKSRASSANKCIKQEAFAKVKK